MIQFLLIPMILFFNSFGAKDSDTRIKCVDDLSFGKQIAEKYKNQKNSDSGNKGKTFSSISTNNIQNYLQLTQNSTGPNP